MLMYVISLRPNRMNVAFSGMNVAFSGIRIEKVANESFLTSVHMSSRFSHEKPVI
jgi:hypothetical protein